MLFSVFLLFFYNLFFIISTISFCGFHKDIHCIGLMWNKNIHRCLKKQPQERRLEVTAVHSLYYEFCLNSTMTLKLVLVSTKWVSTDFQKIKNIFFFKRLFKRNIKEKAGCYMTDHVIIYLIPMSLHKEIWQCCKVTHTAYIQINSLINANIIRHSVLEGISNVL